MTRRTLHGLFASSLTALALLGLAVPASAAPPGHGGPAKAHQQKKGKGWKADAHAQPPVVVAPPAPQVVVVPAPAPRAIPRRQAPRVVVVTPTASPPAAWTPVDPTPGFEARIARGLATGRLTIREARQLRRQATRLDVAQARYLRDGFLDRRERRTLAKLESQLEVALQRALRNHRRA